MSTNSITVRRSILLPQSLVQDAMKLVKPKGRLTFNGLVKMALQELINKSKREALLREMGEMAADRQIQAEYHRIEQEFTSAQMDGLDND
jgi:hypothetical protein